ncbi:MAG TPA: hypothetical protein VIO33_14705 [Burkholderiaceae bacterium]
MQRLSVRAAKAVLGFCVLLGAALSAPCGYAADFGIERPSDDARYAAEWILDSGDHQGRPFAIVDKRAARIYVFDTAADGAQRLTGASPVLIGLASGDFAIPDIAQRTPASLRPDERTTPAGRFDTEPGHNDKGEAIVWVDYEASLAIHRLRPAPAVERRTDRLASPDAADHRISYGCVVVPVEFYETVIAATLGKRRGVVYVLPESRSVRAMFGAFELGKAVVPQTEVR